MTLPLTDVVGVDEEEPQAAMIIIAEIVRIDFMTNEIRMVFSCEIFV
jgi:hypothetical protein